MGIELGTLFLVGVLYLCVLFAIAWLTDRNVIPASLAGKPWVYTLSLGVFACGWSLFGMTAVAEGHGYSYLSYFVGTGALFLFAPLLLLPLLRICRRMQFTSLVDVLAYRYRGTAVGAIVTLGMIATSLPLMAAQIRVVSSVASLLGKVEPQDPAGGGTALAFAAAIAVFAILFGTRPISDRERHSGLVVTMAFESFIKLVAFLVIGVLAVHAAFGGTDGMHSWLAERPALTGALGRASGDSESHILMLMFFGAATGLPHLLHMALYENPRMRAVTRASWGFPLLLLLLSLPVLPVLWSGMRLGVNVPAEYYAAGIGIATNSSLICFAAFIVGLSAASSTIIVMSLALSSICLNNFVLPLYRLSGATDLYRGLAVVRSLLIALVILGAHVFYSTFAGRLSLETLGFSSFVAAAQFFPGTLALLYWPGATRAGFIAGLLSGFAVWLLALLGPDTGHLAGAVQASLPFAIESSHWGSAAINSLALNTLVLITLSWLGKQSPEEREAAQACNANNLSGPPGYRLQLRSPREFVEALQPALGRESAERQVARALDDLAFDAGESRPFAMRRLRDRIEANMSRLMGAAVAMDVVGSSFPHETRAAGETPDDLLLVDSRLDSHRRDLTGLAAELDAMRRFYRTTLQDLPIGVCGVNTSGEIVMWNHGIEKTTGIAAAAVIGSMLDSLPAPWAGLLGDFLASGNSRVQPQRVERGDSSAWISLHSSANESSPDARFVLLEDVTENRLLQEELFHSERLASIGRLAAGVAHEIGNPVTGIDCLAQNLLAESTDENVGEGARQILRQTHRIGSIVGTLVNFAHYGGEPTGAAGALEPAACADEAIYLLGLDQQGTAVQFRNECPRGLQIAGDGQKLLQVFVNLLSNARDASTAQGLIRIAAHAQGAEVIVEIIDQGCGIPEARLGKVFEPFFTTKSPGEGTGLGLALVYSIVTGMGGSVTAESPVDPRTGRGTRMVLRFEALTAT